MKLLSNRRAEDIDISTADESINFSKVAILASVIIVLLITVSSFNKTYKEKSIDNRQEQNQSIKNK